MFSGKWALQIIVTPSLPYSSPHLKNIHSGFFCRLIWISLLSLLSLSLYVSLFLSPALSLSLCCSLSPPACSHVPRVSASEAGDPGPLGAPHGPVPPQGGWHHGCAAQPDGLPASSDEALGHHAAHHTVSLSAPLPPTPALPVIFFSFLWLSPFLDEPLPPPSAGCEALTGVRLTAINYSPHPPRDPVCVWNPVKVYLECLITRHFAALLPLNLITLSSCWCIFFPHSFYGTFLMLHLKTLLQLD